MDIIILTICVILIVISLVVIGSAHSYLIKELNREIFNLKSELNGIYKSYTALVKYLERNKK